MGFEKFTGGGRGYRPKVSIRKNGQIGFGRAAVSKFNIKNYKYAILYFDREVNRVGIELTNQKEDAAYNLQLRGDGAAISGRSFLDYYEIDYSKSRRYDVAVDPETQFLVIHVGEHEK